jgi:hypothetical protein
MHNKHLSGEAFYGQLAEELDQRERANRLALHIHPVAFIPVSTFADTALGRRFPPVLHAALLNLTGTDGVPYIRIQTFDAGQTIVQEGESGRDFFMIVQGAAQVRGTGDTLIAELGKGDSFGELAVLKQDHSRMASAVARTRCLLIAVDAALAQADGRLKILFKNAMLDVIEEKLFDAYGEIRRLRGGAQDR